MIPVKIVKLVNFVICEPHENSESRKASEPAGDKSNIRVNLGIAHLRIGHMVGNPEVGNPEPYQSSGLPTSIITLFSVYLLDLGWWLKILGVLK